jgi:hypothetical protein
MATNEPVLRRDDLLDVVEALNVAATGACHFFD